MQTPAPLGRSDYPRAAFNNVVYWSILVVSRSLSFSSPPTLIALAQTGVGSALGTCALVDSGVSECAAAAALNAYERQRRACQPASQPVKPVRFFIFKTIPARTKDLPGNTFLR